MYGEPFQMNDFQRRLYRYHMLVRERHERRTAVTVTTIGLDDKSEKTAVLDRTLPGTLAGFTRIVRTDRLKNEGEERQEALRCVAEIREGERRGALEMTLDLLHGRVRFFYTNAHWHGSEVGTGDIPLTELMQPDRAPEVLALYRICELLDAQDDPFARGFIAEAMAHPEGLGFPKFTRGFGQHLLQRYRETAPAAADGPTKVVAGTWYAHGHRPFVPYGKSADLEFWIGKAVAWGDGLWADDVVEVAYENEGFGRAVPSYRYYVGRIHLAKGDRIFPLTAEEVAEAWRFAPKPFGSASSVLHDSVKTAE